jgi:hypothetical protein
MISVEYWAVDWPVVAGLTWVIVLAFIVCLLLGFGMGANDCANSYGKNAR